MYEERLLLYVDILGWSVAVRSSGSDPRLLKAVELVHTPAEVHNKHFRQKCIERDGKGINVFPTFLKVQFGAFSDHFVYSIPESLGPRIVTIASKLVVDLLRIGWLTRGAIVLGQLYHKDNVIFGPALLEAVDIEENRSVYPRILISDAALRLFDTWELDPRYKTHIKDQFGRFVVNPFALPFEATGSHKDALIESFVTLNFGFEEIRPALEEQVAMHTRADRGPQAEKWAYVRNFITGPVFSETPELKRFW